MTFKTELAETLAAIVGDEHLLRDPQLRAGYEHDITGRFSGQAAFVVRPADSQQVAAVICACAAAEVGVIPQGGNTGLVGGGVPRDGEVIMSLRRLDAVGPVDRANGQLTVGAGATLAAVQRACESAGLNAGLDFAARDSCTIGGVVACDAGGLRALRYGTARARVVGIEAVLADGSIIRRTSGLIKDNAGYDLPALIVGSEGTLAVITAVRWRAVPKLAARACALVPCATIEAAAALLAGLRRDAPSLEACELITDEGLTLAIAHQRRESPVRQRLPFYVLVELAAQTDPTDELIGALEAAAVSDAVFADGAAERERLWAWREGMPEAVTAVGVPHKIDVGIALERLPDFCAQLSEQIARQLPQARTILWGHLADGNIHVNVLGLDPDDQRIDDLVLSLTLDHGGTISAEHGIGVAKAGWLRRARGDGEYQAMRAIKQALDPKRILNPGVDII